MRAVKLLNLIEEDNRSRILSLGNKFRKRVGLKNISDWEVSAGSCEEWSFDFVNELKQEGIEAEAIHGTYTSDNPEIGETPHWWIEADGKYIVDLSIDQFEDIVGNQWLRNISDKRYEND
jgi:hypothetical protein